MYVKYICKKYLRKIIKKWFLFFYFFYFYIFFENIDDENFDNNFQWWNNGLLIRLSKFLDGLYSHGKFR